MEKYDHKKIEEKWAKSWVKNKTFTPDLEKAPNPYYALFMFPYPSAEGLHIGNFFNEVCIDVMAKYKKLNGFDVFEPIGWDAFGIHLENYALKIGERPQATFQRTTKNFRKQLENAGLGLDWTRMISTTQPEYYKWTQWIFTKLFEKGLAVQKEALLSWCPNCKTVLADEQIIDGECERCGTKAEKKKMKQWFFKITDYAQRLLDGLEEMDWSEITKSAQSNWIGRSEGASIKFPISNFQFPINSKDQNQNTKNFIEVFTTRPDTLFGATYMVLSPEHELVKEIATTKQKEAVEEYIKTAAAKSDLERTESKEKTGVFTGAYAVNPVNDEKIPVWIADYVLMGYGTGAIMAVPAHDERDWEFAKKYNLPVVQVVKKNNIIPRSYLMGGGKVSDEELEKIGVKILEKTKDGDRKLEIPIAKLEEYKKLIKEKLDNGFWNEIVGEEILFIFKDKEGNIKEIILSKETTEEIEKLGAEYNDEPYLGETSTWKWVAENDTYTDLIIHSEDGVNVNSGFLDGLETSEAKKKIIAWLEEKEIGKGVVNYKLRDWCISRQRYWGPPVPIVYCEKCGTQVVPEKDLPVILPELEKGWEPAGDGRGPLAKVESFIKTTCPKCGGSAEREADVMDNFLDSAWYFFRYISPQNNENIFDSALGKKWLPVDLYVGGNEHAVLHLMYTRFITMALHDLGVVDFDNPFKKFRANGMILKDGKKMSKSKGNIISPEEYGEKVGYDALKTYLLFLGPLAEDRSFTDEGVQGTKRWAERVFKLQEKVKNGYEDNEDVVKKLHQTIKSVSEDFSDQKYNTAIAKLMELSNTLGVAENISLDTWKKSLVLFAPFLPALAEELWSASGNEDSIFSGNNWPKYDAELAKEEEIELVVQINSKVRDRIKVKADISEEEAKKLALESEKIKKLLEGKEVKKIIFIEGKLINIVI